MSSPRAAEPHARDTQATDAERGHSLVPTEHVAGLLQCISSSRLVFFYWPDVTKPDFWWSQTALQLLGYEPGDLTPSMETFGAMLHADDRARILDRMRAVAESKILGDEEFEYRLRRKDGKYSWVRGFISAVCLQDTGTIVSLGVSRIIDRDKLAERAALKLSEDALNTVLNEIGYPVVLMSADGVIVQANDAAARVGGYSATCGRFCPFLHEDDGSALFAGFIEGVVNLGQSATRELQRFGRWWHIHLVPLRDTDNEVCRVLLLAQDITLIKAEQAAQLARERALTRTLVREVHHRIKNHLQGLIGLLRRYSGPEFSHPELMDAAVAQIQSIATVHGLLAKSGQTSIDFGALVEQSIAVTKTGSSIAVHFTLESASWQPMALSEEEAVPLAVAVGELLTNAIKHTADTSGARVEGKLCNRAGRIELTISNTPARLPEGFRLSESTGRQSGLDLVQALLSRDRSELAIWQDGDTVIARLHLIPARSAAADSAEPRQ